MAISALVANTGILAQQIQNNTSNIVSVSASVVSSNAAMTTYVNALNSSMLANLGTSNTNLSGSINALALSTQANLVNVTSALAPKNSPTFTGTPNAPTPAPGDNSTKVATTAFVQNAVAGQVTYNVSTSVPTGTPAFTFWFQV